MSVVPTREMPRWSVVGAPAPGHQGEVVTESVDLDEVAGIDLLARELGGVKITEYDEG